MVYIGETVGAGEVSSPSRLANSPAPTVSPMYFQAPASSTMAVSPPSGTITSPKRSPSRDLTTNSLPAAPTSSPSASMQNSTTTSGSIFCVPGLAPRSEKKEQAPTVLEKAQTSGGSVLSEVLFLAHNKSGIAGLLPTSAYALNIGRQGNTWTI